MSLSSRIIIRLTITTAIATGISYGWLYIKQSRVDSYLRQLTLVKQAREISSYIELSPDGSVEVDLPAKLSEAYNSPGSRYRYAVRDDAGRIIVTSGRLIGPLPKLLDAEERKFYQYKSDADNASVLGAAVRTDIGNKSYFTQVEQTLPMTRSLNAAVFNEFFMDGGWLQIPFLFALLGSKRMDLEQIARPSEGDGNARSEDRAGKLDFAVAVEGHSQGNPAARQLLQ